MIYVFKIIVFVKILNLNFAHFFIVLSNLFRRIGKFKFRSFCLNICLKLKYDLKRTRPVKFENFQILKFLFYLDLFLDQKKYYIIHFHVLILYRKHHL